jgi:hypothetical protein
MGMRTMRMENTNLESFFDGFNISLIGCEEWKMDSGMRGARGGGGHFRHFRHLGVGSVGNRQWERATEVVPIFIGFFALFGQVAFHSGSPLADDPPHFSSPPTFYTFTTNTQLMPILLVFAQWRWVLSQRIEGPPSWGG